MGRDIRIVLTKTGAALDYDRAAVAPGTESVERERYNIIFGTDGCTGEFNGTRQFYEASGAADMSADWLLRGFYVSGIDSSAGEFVGIDNLQYFVIPEPTTILLLE